VIARLLVANRGEIARRVLRTARGMGIATVAVFADPDRDALFVAEADEAVPLGGVTPAESYLRVDAVLEAAERTGADAVHPGYGFLAEQPELAAGCRKRGLTFVGPPPEVLAVLGDKVEAKRVMAAAGLPVLPGAEVTGLDGAGLLAAAERVGLPVMVKATFGGGGIGMRVVADPAELQQAVDAARRQAGAAFGDDAVFLERLLAAPRHVEVQVLADAHGRVVHLFERECSVQRRHQKLVEEAPSPAVHPDLRDRLGEAAVAAAEAVGYVGAGTVEFLLEPGGPAEERGGGFYFLEVNARIQVEHPVTEAVTGLDLVRLQLLVAAGEPLPEEAVRAGVRGHAVEARLYAEDPRRGFLPQAGTLHRFRIDQPPGGARGIPGGFPGESGGRLRVDAGVADGSVVGVHYDPLLAKVIAHAPSRAEAAGLLAAALAGARLHGVTTNRDLLVGVLRHPAFLAGDTDTAFLDRHPPAALAAEGAGAAPGAERLHAAAAALAAQAARRAAATVQAAVPSGWRNNPSQPQRVDLQGEGGVLAVGYRLGRGGALEALEVDGEALPGARLWGTRPAGPAAWPASPARHHQDRPAAWPGLGGAWTWLVDLEVAGVRRRFEVHRVGDVHYLDGPLGHAELRELPRFPQAAEDQAATAAGSLASPLPGVVRRVAAAPGDRVAAGALLVVVEAMKLEHRIGAPHAGRVREVLVAEGQEVDAGTPVAVLEEVEDG
jgi:propionyl-CoA carboxylase alpha chain